MDKSRDIELEKKIDAYIKGELSSKEVEALWVELLKKPEYIDLLETEIDVKRLYEAREKNQTTTYYWKWIAAAAAVVLIVLAINFFDTDSHKSLQEWTEAEITLSENLASAPVTRSASEIASPDSMLNIGFKAAVEGNINRAKEIFKSILDQYDNPEILSKAYLNLGILQYNSGSFETSIGSFRNAITINQDDQLLTERAYWYMGHAYINIKQLKEARSAIQQAYNLGEIYKEEAFKMLKRLDYKLGNIDYDNFEEQINGSQ